MPRLINGHYIVVGDTIRLGDVVGVVKSCSLDGYYTRHYIVRREDGKDARITDKPERVGISHTYFAELVCDPLPTDVSSWLTSRIIHTLTTLMPADQNRLPASWRAATTEQRTAFWNLVKGELDNRIPVPVFDNTPRPKEPL